MNVIEDFNDYLGAYERAQNHPHEFWGNVAQSFTWKKPWNNVLQGDFKNLPIKWFVNGKLNITENCLDRHLSTRGDHTALIFEPNDPKQNFSKYTYKELHTEVCQFANILKAQGIKKGDVVCLYMSMTPELMIALLACARIGAIHTVVFGGFSSNALANRIQDSKARILVTNDGGFRGEKIIPLKEIADEALKETPSIEKVIVVQRAKNSIQMKTERDLWYHDLKQEASSECPAEEMDSEDPLFILYTSGSTGKPKGLLHTTAGYMVYAHYTYRNVFQVEKNDIFWCTADIGWITGHTYLTYGPLLNGNTTLMFEGVPTYPDAGRFWDTIDKHQVTHFYTAPTAIRSLQSQDLNFVTRSQLQSLKVLGSVGEPINEEAWEWYNIYIGKNKCPIVDTWWQTETGGIMISPLANVTKIIPTYATFPLPGVDTVLVNSQGKILENDEAEGQLCIRSPWPGMARSIYGDPQRYQETYFSTFPGMYCTGDGAKRDEQGNYRITGRVDDVINVSGHRIGTAEVEDTINLHESVIESAVVGHPHDIKGEALYAFIILAPDKEHPEHLKKDLNSLITEHIGAFAKLDKVQVVPGLPKTRSGKIMRRILRKIASGSTSSFGDLSTIVNPEIIDEICSHSDYSFIL